VRGGSYRSGEQTCGSEHKRMTAAPKDPPDRSSCRGTATRRPAQDSGKANVSGEATGACTLGAAGVGVQTRGEGLAEITSGRACAQQRLAASCKDQPCEAMPKPDGGQQVWRMSPYERRRRGNALPGGRACLPRGGNADTRQRGSGCLAVPGWLSDAEPRKSRLSKRGRADEQTSVWRGACGPVLKPRCDWKGSSRKSQGQNRTGEIPTSGIVGGLAETWTRWEPE
jgi:hypothetical protein